MMTIFGLVLLVTATVAADRLARRARLAAAHHRRHCRAHARWMKAHDERMRRLAAWREVTNSVA